MKYIFISFIVCSFAQACSVPVFRYGLERWHPDPYIIQLNYNDSHSNELSEILKTLRNIDNGYSFAVKKIKTSNNFPTINLRYPYNTGIRTNVWSGPMSVGNIKEILDSPVRREIARRIVSGDSAVFLLLKGDDEKKNKKTAEILSKNLPVIENEIKLPHEYADIPEEDLDIYDTNVVFKLSMLELSKTNRDDKVFIKMLTRMIPTDILTNSYPIVYPIFARGRMLAALLAKDVTSRNLERICEYIAGECSCEIKGQNPGIDLLFSVDWDSLIEPGINIDAMLPPLAGFSEFAPAARQTNISNKREFKHRNKLKRWKNVIIILCLIAVGAAIYVSRK